MRRNYTVVDLVRFAQLSKERAQEKPIDLLKEYDKLYPELSSKQKYENLLKSLGMKHDVIKSVCPKCGEADYEQQLDDIINYDFEK